MSNRAFVSVVSSLLISAALPALPQDTARSGRAPRPGSAATPVLIQQMDVTIGTGRWALPGKLSVPSAEGPVPAIVLVYGMSLRDGNGTVGSNRVFRDLAWGLARRGIATLRYDKRPQAHREKLAALKDGWTANEETIDDALAAVALLKVTDGIDPGRIFLLGHGVAGTLAPRIGKRSGDIAGLIIMAAVSGPLEDAIVARLRHIYAGDGEITPDEKKELALFEKERDRVKGSELTRESIASRLPRELPAAYWLDLRGYNPAGTAAKLAIPMLVMQGGRDYQVEKEDFERWREALSSRSDVKLLFYPSMNHIFVAGEGKGSPEEYRTRRSVEKKVIDDIVDWVRDQRVAPAASGRPGIGGEKGRPLPPRPASAGALHPPE